MGIASSLKNISVEMDSLKQQSAELQSGYFSRADQKKLEANLRSQGELYWQAVEARRTMLDLDEDERKILDLRLKGETETADELERQKKLKAEIAGIKSLGLDRVAEKQLVDTATMKSEGEKKIKENERVAKAVQELLDGIDEDENRIAKRRRDAAEKQADEEKQLAEDQAKEEQRIAEEGLERMRDEQKEREQIAQKQADAEAKIREQGAKDFEAAEKKKQDAIEARFTLEQKLELAKERVKKAQQAAARARGTPGQEAAEARLAEAQGGLMDVREQQIQRIMGGSTSAAAAQRAERKAVRDRARAERILDKREAIKAADAAARGEKRLPNRKGDAAVNLAAPPDKKDAQEQTTLLGKIEQEMKNLNQKLTVA
jgi:hypothetical protein